MSRMLTLGFEFEDSFYYSVILVKDNAVSIEYKITVMDGKLQALLTGDNVIKEKDGQLNYELPKGQKLKDLKLKIAEALGVLLHMPIQPAF